MERINLEIQDFEDKKAKTGTRYTRFKTDQGWMSAFDKDVIEKLKANEGKTVSVTIAVDEEKGFKNIRVCHGEAKETEEKAETKKESVKETPGRTGFNATSMYVSYAKDILVQLITNNAGKEVDINALMDLSCDLVERAKKKLE